MPFRLNQGLTFIQETDVTHKKINVERILKLHRLSILLLLLALFTELCV